MLVGEVTSFDASDSYDPDGTIVSYDWDFGDDETGLGETTTHVYTTAGIYTVTLTVTDNQDATSTDTLTVTVQTFSFPAKIFSCLVNVLVLQNPYLIQF